MIMTTCYMSKLYTKCHFRQAPCSEQAIMLQKCSVYMHKGKGMAC